MLSVALDAGDMPEAFDDQVRPKRSRRKRKTTEQRSGDDTVIEVEAGASGDRIAPDDSRSTDRDDRWNAEDADRAGPGLGGGETMTSKPRKKKKKSKESTAEGGDEIVSASKKSSRKKKSRSESNEGKNRSSSLFPDDAVLRELSQHLSEDMVDGSDNAISAPAFSTSGGVWHTDLVPSQVSGVLFVESNGAFKAMDRQKWVAQSHRPPALPSDAHKSSDMPTAIKDGLRLHSGIHKLAGYCHGLLGGIALWQCIMVYQLSAPHFDTADFLRHYCPLAAIASTLFYLLLVVSIVALMARCDIGGDGVGLWSLVLGWDTRLIALLLYWITLVLSLTAADGDDALATSCRTATSGNDTLVGTQATMHLPTWVNLNLCRCLGSMLAFLILSLSSNQSNLLSERLRTGVETE